MRIAFFTEMGFNGKVQRNHTNMRTEFAWMCSLQADHFNLTQTPQEDYDLGIVINSKKNPHLVEIKRYKTRCKKIAVMQEGPFWYFQDYDLTNQISYYNNLIEADIIFAHNEQDRKYFKGLTNHSDVRILPTLLIEESAGVIDEVERNGIMIGGNMVSWYGGFDSFMLAKSVTDQIYQPSMGRKQEGENQLGINQLPYLEWKDWIRELNKRKLGIHMMRTHAAGTFALNCSFLGIPCVGYKGLDTQRILHPNLSVDDGDLETARRLIGKLWDDSNFYEQNCNLTKKLYLEYFHESKFNVV